MTNALKRLSAAFLALALAVEPGLAANRKSAATDHGLDARPGHAADAAAVDGELDLSLGDVRTVDVDGSAVALSVPTEPVLETPVIRRTLDAAAAPGQGPGTAAVRQAIANPTAQAIAHGPAAGVPANLQKFYDGVQVPGGTLQFVEGGPVYRLKFTPNNLAPVKARPDDGRKPVYVIVGAGIRHYNRGWSYEGVKEAVEEVRKANIPGYEGLELWLVEDPSGLPPGVDRSKLIEADPSNVRPEHMKPVLARILKKLKDENAVLVAASSVLDNYILWGPALQEAARDSGNNPNIAVNPFETVLAAIKKGKVREKLQAFPEHAWPYDMIGRLSDSDIEEKAVAAFERIMRSPKGLPEVVIKLETSAGKAMNIREGLNSPEAVRAAIRRLREQAGFWQAGADLLPPSPDLGYAPLIMMDRKIDSVIPGLEYDVDPAMSRQPDGTVDIVVATTGNPIMGKSGAEKGYMWPALFSKEIEHAAIFSMISAYFAAWHPFVPFGTAHVEGMPRGNPEAPSHALIEINPLRIIGGSAARLFHEWSGVSMLKLHVLANLGLPLPLPAVQPQDTLAALAILPAHTGAIDEVFVPAGVGRGGFGTPAPRMIGPAARGTKVYDAGATGHADTYVGGAVVRAATGEEATARALDILRNTKVRYQDGTEHAGDAYYSPADFPRLPPAPMRPGEVRMLPDAQGPHVFHFLYKPKKEGFLDDAGGPPPADFFKGRTPVYLQLGSGHMPGAPNPDLEHLMREAKDLQNEMPGLRLVVADLEGNRPPANNGFDFVTAPGLLGMTRDESSLRKVAEDIIRQVEAQGGVVVGAGTVFNRLIQFVPIVQETVKKSGMNPYIPVQSFAGLLATQDKATYREKIAQNDPAQTVPSVRLEYPEEFDAVLAAARAAKGLPTGANDAASRAKRDAWWDANAERILAPMIKRLKPTVRKLLKGHKGRSFMMKLTTSMGKNGIWGDIPATVDEGIAAYLKILHFVFELNLNRSAESRANALVPERPNVVFELMLELDPKRPALRGRGEGDSELMIRRLPGGILEVMGFPMGNPLAVPGSKTELGFTVPAMLDPKLSLEAVVNSVEAQLASFFPHLPFGNTHAEWIYDGRTKSFFPIESNALRPMGWLWSLDLIENWSGISLVGQGMRGNMGLPLKSARTGKPERSVVTRKIASPVTGILRDVIIPQEIRDLPYLKLRIPAPIDPSEDNRANWPDIFDLRSGQNRAGPVFLEVWSDPRQPVEQAAARAREIMSKIKLVIRTDRDDPSTERIVPADMELYPEDSEVRLPL